MVGFILNRSENELSGGYDTRNVRSVQAVGLCCENRLLSFCMMRLF